MGDIYRLGTNWGLGAQLGAQNVYGQYGQGLIQGAAAASNYLSQVLAQEYRQAPWDDRPKPPVAKYRGSHYATPGLHPVWGVHTRGYRYGGR